MIFDEARYFQIQIVNQNSISLLIAHLICNGIEVFTNLFNLNSGRKLVVQVTGKQIVIGNGINNGLKLGRKIQQTL